MLLSNLLDGDDVSPVEGFVPPSTDGVEVPMIVLKFIHLFCDEFFDLGFADVSEGCFDEDDVSVMHVCLLKSGAPFSPT